MTVRGGIKRRVLSLERNAAIEHTAMMEQIQQTVFEAINLTYEDGKLLDAIIERGEPSTPEEQAALQRFSAEYEAAFKIVSSRKRGPNSAL